MQAYLYHSAQQQNKTVSEPCGLLTGKSHCGNRLYLFFGSRIPKDLRNDRSELNLAELTTRLHLLQLIKEEEGLFSQEIISLLGLCQSAASRHLKQLTAIGFLNIKQFEAGKQYSLNKVMGSDPITSSVDNRCSFANLVTGQPELEAMTVV